MTGLEQEHEAKEKVLREFNQESIYLLLACQGWHCKNLCYRRLPSYQMKERGEHGWDDETEPEEKFRNRMGTNQRKCDYVASLVMNWDFFKGLFVYHALENHCTWAKIETTEETQTRTTALSTLSCIPEHVLDSKYQEFFFKIYILFWLTLKCFLPEMFFFQWDKGVH